MYYIKTLKNDKYLKGIVFNSDIFSVEWSSTFNNVLGFATYNRAFLFLKFVCDVKRDVVYHYEIIKV